MTRSSLSNPNSGLAAIETPATPIRRIGLIVRHHAGFVLSLTNGKCCFNLCGMNKNVRWRQRFSNLENAFQFLKGGLEKTSLDPYQEAGIIQSFEFTFELSWKTKQL